MTSGSNPPRLRSARVGLFAVGITVGLMAEQVVLFAVPLLIYQDSRRVSLLGLAYALEWAPYLIAYPLGGILADRDGGPRLFRVANVGRALVLGSSVVLCLGEPGWTIPVLMVNGALLTTLVAPIHMAIEKVVPQLGQGEALARMQGMVQNMELLSLALGPGLAMVAVVLLGKVWLLGLAAGMFATAAACWLSLPRAAAAPTGGDARTALAELRLGWSLLFGNRPVVLLAAVNFTMNLALAVTMGANAAVVTGVFRQPQSAFAMLNVFAGVAGLLNLAVTPVLLKRFQPKVIGTVGFALACCSLLLLGLSHSYPVYAIGFVAVEVGVAYYNTFNRTQRVQVIPSEHLGKVMGPFFLINVLAFPIGGLLISTVGAWVGPQHLVAWLALLLAVVGAVLVPLTARSLQNSISGRGRTPAGTLAASEAKV
ncbi:MFS transporter [Kitasatospora sp. MAP5-34]|uniref:MFS transporter n=1 Tax=Kitasatospora sp. MAP5-34 TaxID=3035102 RepID=UPI0024733B94|nr:MFS transporter [Kitasatospora sp. MAP5-34]MDH6578164.1 Na+/melibiose symporter-like transporter [Kitasatospora sp. MAP5-34]